MSNLINRADAIEAVLGLTQLNGRVPTDSVIFQIKALPSAEAVQLKQTDTLIIADALRYLAQDTERHLSDRTRADALREQILQYGASMCHSADAEQGEWVDVQIMTQHGMICLQKCSVCGFQGVLGLYNFCPNCGARMKGGDTE